METLDTGADLQQNNRKINIIDSPKNTRIFNLTVVLLARMYSAGTITALLEAASTSSSGGGTSLLRTGKVAPDRDLSFLIFFYAPSLYKKLYIHIDIHIHTHSHKIFF